MRGRPGSRLSPVDDAGHASVLVVAILAVAVTLAATLALVASARALGASATSSADLAALAGAQAAASPWRGSEPCEAAGAAAHRNRAVLVSCTTDALGIVEVTVRAPARGGLARIIRDRSASARAGPEWVREPAAGRGPS
ncbi:Rv3654c family TadE-like protein [Sanguibacter sp. A247]|uniref:Rv3654c family TadE-like protein n=1 Tax=unclassified Sanguibacter TaxID=2645534 RepID=UPI003FD83FE1